MPVAPRTFGLNIYLLIGALLAIGALSVFVVAAWTGVKIAFWRRRVRRAEDEYRQTRYAPDGAPYPRATRGICTRCGRYADWVYHLPDGARLCRPHYDELHAPATPPAGAGDP